MAGCAHAQRAWQHLPAHARRPGGRRPPEESLAPPLQPSQKYYGYGLCWAQPRGLQSTASFLLDGPSPPRPLGDTGRTELPDSRSLSDFSVRTSELCSPPAIPGAVIVCATFASLINDSQNHEHGPLQTAPFTRREVHSVRVLVRLSRPLCCWGWRRVSDPSGVRPQVRVVFATAVLFHHIESKTLSVFLQSQCETSV